MKKKKAFTLTELLVVVVVIAALAAVALPKYRKVVESQKTTEAEGIFSAVRTEQERRCTLGKPYATLAELNSLVPNTNTQHFRYGDDTSTGKGLIAQSQNGEYNYQLKMQSYRSGQICCAGDDCSKLNKNYPACGKVEEEDDGCSPAAVGLEDTECIGCDEEPDPEPVDLCEGKPDTSSTREESESCGEDYDGEIIYTITTTGTCNSTTGEMEYTDKKVEKSRSCTKKRKECTPANETCSHLADVFDNIYDSGTPTCNTETGEWSMNGCYKEDDGITLCNSELAEDKLGVTNPKNPGGKVYYDYWKYYNDYKEKYYFNVRAGECNEVNYTCATYLEDEEYGGTISCDDSGKCNTDKCCREVAGVTCEVATDGDYPDGGPLGGDSCVNPKGETISYDVRSDDWSVCSRTTSNVQRQCSQIKGSGYTGVVYGKLTEYYGGTKEAKYVVTQENCRKLYWVKAAEYTYYPKSDRWSSSSISTGEDLDFCKGVDAGTSNIQYSISKFRIEEGIDSDIFNRCKDANGNNLTDLEHFGNSNYEASCATKGQQCGFAYCGSNAWDVYLLECTDGE